MSQENYTDEIVLVPCHICLAEVPISEVIVSEAADYVAHFCGLECYDRWQKNPDNPTLKDLT